MAFNQDAAFRIRASVEGQSAVDQLRKSMDDMSGSINGLVGKFTGLGTAFKGLAVAAGAMKFLDAVTSVMELGAEMAHLSDRTGVTVETLSTFRAAGKMVGIDIETIAKSFGKFDVATSKAQTGNKEAAAAFRTLGISVQDLKKLSPDELILRTADAFSKMEDGPTKARIAVDLFGKAGYEMIPMLNKGREEIEKLGVKMSTDFADRSRVFHETLVRIQSRFKMVTADAVKELLPTLQEIAKAFLDLTDKKPQITEFMQDVAEGMRLLAVATMAVYQAVKSTVMAFIDQVRIKDELRAFAVDVGKSLAPWASPEAQAEAKASAAKHLQTVQDLAKDMVNVYKDAYSDFDAFKQRLLKNSLVFGEGTREEILARQREETKTPPKKKGKDGNGDGLDIEKVDKYKEAIMALGEEAAKLKFQVDNIELYGDKVTTAKVAQAQFDTTVGKFAGESEPSKRALLALAAVVDEYSQRLRIAQAAMEYENETKKIAAVADVTERSNLAKAEAAALQDLENKGIKAGTELYEKLAKARLDALAAQTRTQEQQKRDDFVQKMREQTAAMRLELQAVGMSTLEYKKRTEALKLDAQVAEQTKGMTEEGAAAFRDAAAAALEERNAVLDSADAQQKSFTVGARQALDDYAKQLRDVAGETKNAVGNAFKGMEDALVNFVKTGKLDFKSLADSIISDMIRIAMQQMIIRPMMRAIGFAMFAEGGVMTGSGKMPLRTYANGGIANRPQMAVFGEGSMPEAFVPLPDGRRIPVAMQGAQAGTQQVIHQTISIDARGADAGVEQRIQLAAKRGAQEGYQMVMRDIARGGLGARLTGRA